MKTISIATGTGIRRTKAHVFGKWAAHERWQGDGECGDWVVTLLGDGRNLGDGFGVFDRDDACKVARALDASGLRAISSLRGELYLVQSIVAEALAQ